MGGIVSKLPEFIELNQLTGDQQRDFTLSQPPLQSFRILFDNEFIDEGVVVVNMVRKEIWFFSSLGSAFITHLHLPYNYMTGEISPEIMLHFNINDEKAKWIQGRLLLELAHQKNMTEEQEAKFNYFMENSNLRPMQQTPVGLLPATPRRYDDNNNPILD